MLRGADRERRRGLVTQLQIHAVVCKIAQCQTDLRRHEGFQHFRLHERGTELRAEFVSKIACQTELDTAHAVLASVERADVGDVLDVLDLPLELQTWEPSYPIATYSDDGIDAPSPSDVWRHDWTEIEADEIFDDMIVDDPFVREALRSLVEPWTSSSGGQESSVVVDGTVNDAMSALGHQTFRVTPLTTEQALQWLAWCGSSGGAHGRRRGAALGRFGVWWLLAAIGGFTEEWDELRDSGALSHEVGDTAQALRWYRVDIEGHHPFELNLVAEDPDNDITVALLAHDRTTQTN